MALRETPPDYADCTCRNCKKIVRQDSRWGTCTMDGMTVSLDDSCGSVEPEVEEVEF